MCVIKWYVYYNIFYKRVNSKSQKVLYLLCFDTMGVVLSQEIGLENSTLITSPTPNV